MRDAPRVGRDRAEILRILVGIVLQLVERVGDDLIVPQNQLIQITLLKGQNNDRLDRGGSRSENDHDQDAGEPVFGAVY
ncbi:MAG: hypothetical protein IIY36_05045, partial [Lachnospiraceae bacterium]|nr:hypothetical protein [Lachnospiraceae bacterium]